MTTNYKILGQTIPSPNSQSNHYSVPDNKSALVKSINITNRSNNDDVYSIAIAENSEVSHQFIIAYSGTQEYVSYSTDGYTWSKNLDNSNYMLFNPYSRPLSVNGKFYILDNASTAADIRSSTDGVTWPYPTVAIPNITSNSELQYGNGLFVVAGESNYGYSTDAVAWTVDSFPNVMYGATMAFGDGKFVAVSQDYCMYSTDGITWTQYTAPQTLPDRTFYDRKIYFIQGYFILLNSNTFTSSNTFFVSKDGINWEKRYFPTSDRWTGLAYGNGKFVVGGISGGISTSTDLYNWSQESAPFMGYMTDINYGNNRFFVAGTGEAGAISEDGITWTIVSLPSMTYNASYVGFKSSIPNSKYISYNNVVPANSTISIKTGYTIQENSSIFVQSANGSCTFTTFGAEIS